MHRLLFLVACAARPGLAFHVPGPRARPLGGARALRMSVLDGPGEVIGSITRKATDVLTSPPAVELGTYALKVALQWAIPTAVIVIGVLAVSGGGDDDAKPSGSSSGLAPKAKGLRKLFGLPSKEEDERSNTSRSRSPTTGSTFQFLPAARPPNPRPPRGAAVAAPPRPHSAAR